MKSILFLEFITSVGGVQTVLRNILPGLVNDFKVYFLDPYQNEFDQEIAKIKGLNIIDMPIKPHISALGWNKKYRRPFLLFILGPSYLYYIYKLCGIIKKYKIDLLYVNSKKAVIMTYILHILTGVKYIYHSHGYNSHKDISYLFKCAINSAIKIIAVSNDVKNKLLLAGIEKHKIDVVHNGVDIEEVINLANQKIELNNKKGINIICVCSIHPGKGVHILIESFNKLLKENNDINLHIIGDVAKGGDISYIKKLKNMAEEVNPERILFLGWKQNPYPYIKNTDILVLPSIGGFESFGMVIVEAMALKKAVIGSNIGGIPEVIKDNFNGFLVKPGNVEDLYLKLKYFVEHKDLIKEYGENGYRRVEEYFTTDMQTARIREILHKI